MSLKNKQENGPTWMELGKLYYQKNEFKLSLYSFRQAAKMGIVGLELAYYTGMCMYKLGMYNEECPNLLTEASQNRQWELKSLPVIIQVQMKLKQHAKAISIIDYYQEKRKKDKKLDDEGQMLFLRGNALEALAQFEAAMKQWEEIMSKGLKVEGLESKINKYKPLLADKRLYAYLHREGNAFNRLCGHFCRLHQENIQMEKFRMESSYTKYGCYVIQSFETGPYKNDGTIASVMLHLFYRFNKPIQEKAVLEAISSTESGGSRTVVGLQLYSLNHKPLKFAAENLAVNGRKIPVGLNFGNDLISSIHHYSEEDFFALDG